MPDRPVGEPLVLDGAGVVVTGGGSGIGAALVRRFAAAGARLVVNDLHGSSARAVAQEVGAVSVPGDAAKADGVRNLIAVARDHLGVIDLYCANAGVARGGGPEADPRAWQQSWDVNVMAHVHAARELLPDWLERGRGHLLTTVSAAGLLTMPGAAPYSVTKHAALAFAEWLVMTYAHRGIRVQALCPQGVRTPMLAASGDLGRAVLEPEAIGVDECLDAVLEGLADGRFLILPHPEVARRYAGRAADPDGWLARMNEDQRRLDGLAPPFS